VAASRANDNCRERLAEPALEPTRFGHFAGGAEDERTRNLTAFAAWRFAALACSPK